MNKQGKEKIEWCDFTANPVDGLCKYQCSYCYSMRMRKRFKLKNDVTFKNNWLDKGQADRFIIKNNRPPKIFVGSSHDLFGEWIPTEWIEKILTVAKENPQYIFQFLTKNPKRYLEFEFPKNCWLGTTIDVVNQARLNYLKEKKDNYKFISFEPLLSDMSMLDLSGIDLVIVGADSTKGAKPPEKKWINSIQHPNIFYKKNISKTYAN